MMDSVFAVTQYNSQSSKKQQVFALVWRPCQNLRGFHLKLIGEPHKPMNYSIPHHNDVSIHRHSQH